MTDFDHDTSRYLDRVAQSPPRQDWQDVLGRAQRLGRRARLARLALVGGSATGLAALLFVVAGVIGGDGASLVEKAQAAQITSAPPSGQVSHVRDAYTEASGHVFIAYDAWLGGDGSWCRSVLEEPVTDYALCQAADGAWSAYFPAANEVLRAPAPTATTASTSDDCSTVPSGTRIQKTPRGWTIVYPDGRTVDLPNARAARAAKAAVLKGSCGAAPDTAGQTAGVVATMGDLLATFDLHIVRESGTKTLDGTTYPSLSTTNGDAVLVDPATGQAVAWIPSPAAFGKPVVVWRTQEIVPADGARAHLSLEALHPKAAVRDVSGSELEQRLAAQYPNG